MSKKTKDISLSQEEFEKLMVELSEFDEQSFVALAGTDQYEIVPTVTEDGKVLNSQELSVIKLECEKLGLTLLYRIDKKDGETILVNSESGKTMVLKDGLQ
jgi:hypothetical protein